METKPSHVLIVDNYDSFTYNLYDYVLQTGCTCDVIRNDALSLDQFKALRFDSMILSPGPGRPADAGLLMPIIDYFHDRIPILGICLGHQAIGEYFGARLIKARQPVHGKTSSIEHRGHLVFQGLPNEFEVMRYHSLILEDLTKTELNSIAETKEDEIMALSHQDLPILGFQFHPESILTKHGLKMIEQWIEICSKWKEKLAKV